MATSPIYSWPEPDNTDLVKNGALAIRTMGNAIDTTMATMVPKSTYTAKGSIAGATAASTPANLAVGTNGQLLSADSTSATGLAWAHGGVTTSYTPTWAVTSGTAPSIGNGVLVGKYARVGNFLYFAIRLAAGSTTTFGIGTYTFSIPFAMTDFRTGIAGDAVALDAGVAWYRGYTPNTVEGGFTDKFLVNNVAGQVFSNTSPFVMGNGDEMLIWGSYVI